MSDSLRPHELQHTRPPHPSPTPGVHSDSCPSSQWCHPAISSSVFPFSSCPQSLPSSESFPRSQLFTWGGQSIGVSALASVLPKNTQDWSPSEWTGWISLQAKGLSRVFSSTTVQKHQFFGAQLSSQSVLSRAKKQNVHSKVSLHHFGRPFGRALGDLYLVQVFFILNPVYAIANTIRSKHYSLWVFTNFLHWVNLISQIDCSILQVRSRTLRFTCIPSAVLHSSIHMHSDSRVNRGGTSVEGVALCTHRTPVTPLGEAPLPMMPSIPGTEGTFSKQFCLAWPSHFLPTCGLYLLPNVKSTFLGSPPSHQYILINNLTLQLAYF